MRSWRKTLRAKQEPRTDVMYNAESRIQTLSTALWWVQSKYSLHCAILASPIMLFFKK